jgi:HK97 family phage portal protein
MSWLTRFLPALSGSSRADVALAETPRTPRAAGDAIDLLSVTDSAELDRFFRGLGVGSASGAMVTPETAMRVSTVYRCVSIIAEGVASVPLGVYHDDGTRSERKRDHAVDRLLSRRPNAWQSPYEFRRQLTSHILLTGNAFARIIRSQDGRPTDLLPLNPDRVEVEQRADFSLAYRYRNGNGSAFTPMRPEDVLHLRGLSVDGVTGLSVIGQAREAIGVSMVTEEHAARTFRNGARPSGGVAVEGKLSDEAFDRLKADLAERYEGPQNAGRVILLEEGATFVPFTMSSVDAQFIETRRYTREDIAQMFGVPPFLLGDTTKATAWGSGLEQIMLGFNRFTLGPWLTLWEQAINRDVLGEADRAAEARFDDRALLRGDITTRTAFNAAMLQWGVISPNEVRRDEGFAPREGGDVFYPPPNMAAAPGGAAPETRD